MFCLADIADALEVGLQHEAAALDREQAVYGLDARDELELHPTLAAALGSAGYGVHQEQRYPADRRRRRESEGERCDLVITPDGRPLIDPDADATLFVEPDAVPLEDALWVEVKVVHQYGLEGANPHYSGQLLSTVRQDVAKLAKDPGILHAALLLVLHVADPLVAEHDLGVWQDRCLQRGLPIGAPYRRHLPLTDRLGNTVCAVSLNPVHHL